MEKKNPEGEISADVIWEKKYEKGKKKKGENVQETGRKQKEKGRKRKEKRKWEVKG